MDDIVNMFKRSLIINFVRLTSYFNERRRQSRWLVSRDNNEGSQGSKVTARYILHES